MNGIFFEGLPEENFVAQIMTEIYEDGIYETFLANTKDLVIVDVGANIGLTTLYFAKFASKVYSLEPSAEHFNCLKKAIEFNRADNVIPIKKALYIKSGKFPLYSPPNKTARSLNAVVDVQKAPTEEVEAITLDVLFEEYEIKKVDLLKMDVEGVENEIISGEGFRRVADKIRLVIVETHGWSGRNPEQLVDVLKMRGFEVGKLDTEADLLVAKRK